MKNIFDLHKDILTDYKSYIDSFINIADDKILNTVKNEFETGNLYPEPLVQFNPSFESGGKVEDLVNEGVLVKQFNDIFYDGDNKSWSIYKHQAEAIKKGNDGHGFVVTSGTGSGKSLTYISTIFNHLFKNPSKEGIKAIIVYPLNALINSQGILKLRELHVQMDETVLDAYGWNDIELKHDFYEVDYLPENDRVRFTIQPDVRKEVLKRLLELNHKMHEEEVAAGLWDKKTTSKAKKSKETNPDQSELF